MGLYQIEDHIRGSSPDKRLAARQRYAVPLLNALPTWMIESLAQIEKKSELAEAFRYSLNRWDALCRYAQAGRLEIDNSIAERSIRGIGTGRRNYLFFGSDSGGERAAIIYSLVETCLCRMRHRQVHAERRTMPNRRDWPQFSQDLQQIHSA